MLQTILVPLDGSEVAEQGLTAACRLARETGAALSLVRGVLYLAVDAQGQEADRRAALEALAYLRTVQDRLMQERFVVRVAVLPTDPVGAILFAADLQEPSLISICTHGRSGLSHALLGSVAEAVLRRCATPMLVTRAAAPAQQATAPYHRILVPLDGTRFAEAALSYLAQEQIGSRAELILLRVVAPVAPPYVPDLVGNAAAELYMEADRQTQQHLQEAEAYLQATGASLQRKGAWRARAVVGSAGPEIRAAARAEDVDLIVLASHGRHGLERLLYGSAAQELLHHAEVPLLILPAKEAHATVPEQHPAVRQTT